RQLIPAEAAQGSVRRASAGLSGLCPFPASTLLSISSATQWIIPVQRDGGACDQAPDHRASSDWRDDMPLSGRSLPVKREARGYRGRTGGYGRRTQEGWEYRGYPPRLV